MNDPQWFESARCLAQRALHANPEMGGRLDYMARTTLGRGLTAREVAVFQRSMGEFRADLGSNPQAAKDILAVGESPVDPVLPPAELAEWTMVASQFLNLDEFLTK
jgi:hypothetical protein